MYHRSVLYIAIDYPRQNKRTASFFTLLKEHNVLAGKTKVVVLLEESDGGGASGAGGHDVPRDGHVGDSVRLLLGKALKLQDTLGLELEEGLARGQADIVAALGGGGAEASALATGQQDDADLVLGHLVETNRLPLLGLVRGSLEDRIEALFGQRSKQCGLVVEHGRRAGGSLLVDAVDTLDVEVLELLEQVGLLLSAEVIVVAQEVALAGSLVALLDLLEGCRAGLVVLWCLDGEV